MQSLKEKLNPKQTETKKSSTILSDSSSLPTKFVDQKLPISTVRVESKIDSPQETKRETKQDRILKFAELEKKIMNEFRKEGVSIIKAPQLKPELKGTEKIPAEENNRTNDGTNNPRNQDHTYQPPSVDL